MPVNMQYQFCPPIFRYDPILAPRPSQMFRGGGEYGPDLCAKIDLAESYSVD